MQCISASYQHIILTKFYRGVEPNHSNSIGDRMQNPDRKTLNSPHIRAPAALSPCCVHQVSCERTIFGGHSCCPSVVVR